MEFRKSSMDTASRWIWIIASMMGVRKKIMLHAAAKNKAPPPLFASETGSRGFRLPAPKVTSQALPLIDRDRLQSIFNE